MIFTPVPLVTAPTPLLTEPVPKNAPVSVVDVPAVIVVFAAMKLLIEGAGTTVIDSRLVVSDAPEEFVTDISVLRSCCRRGDGDRSSAGDRADAVVNGCPVPPLNTAVSVVELPAPIVEAAAVKLLITGGATTINVKLWVAGVKLLTAVKRVMMHQFLRFFPRRAFQPILRLTRLNVTPAGKVPDSLSIGAGEPVTQDGKTPGDADGKVRAAFALGECSGYLFILTPNNKGPDPDTERSSPMLGA